LDATEGWSAERWGQILQRVADLFLARADKLAPREIELFDDVLARLTERGDTPSLVRLSDKLPDTKRALPKTVRRLVLHESATVSTPILQFRSLPPDLLVEAAQTKGLEHLKAIAGRHSVDPSIATFLVQRGNADVHHTLVRNRGARLLETDWSRLTELGECDTSLAEQLGRRSDLPDPLKRRIRVKLEDAQLRLVVSSDVEGLVIACKACRLDWATASTIVKNRPGLPKISADDMETARQKFESVPLSTAQRAVRF
jgi:uncharacterized protein (DUF2336 family)